ncbi:ornithine aminotransferase [Yamadazyma tenuis]|nr:ornithine aminotransferase [Yamadazyma tenuis]
MPVVFKKAIGCKVWDVDDNEYLDFGGSYCATNQGHSHPKIVQALIDQAQICALPSRAFTHNLYGDYIKFVCQYFDFEKALPLNGGSEAIEFAIKLARAWGYTKKGISQNEAIVLFAANNYHGRTLGSTSASTTPGARKNYGPFLPKVGPYYGSEGKFIRYNHIEDIEEAFKTDGPNIAAIVLESLQGEAGIYVPKDGYLQQVKRLCEEYNILYIADEVQMGAGRTGTLLSCEQDGIKPDVLVVAKSIGGGVYPTSLVLSSGEIMDCIEPNSHGATFSGSPLSCATSKVALEVLIEDNMIDNAKHLGKIMLDGLNSIREKSSIITDVRGRGLMAGFDIDESQLNGKKVWHVCMLLRSKGIICKMVHAKTIRWAPALVITEEELRFGLRMLEQTINEITALEIADIPDAVTFDYLRY